MFADIEDTWGTSEIVGTQLNPIAPTHIRRHPQAPCAVVALVAALRPVRVVPAGLPVLAATLAYAAAAAGASERSAERAAGARCASGMVRARRRG